MRTNSQILVAEAGDMKITVKATVQSLQQLTNAEWRAMCLDLGDNLFDALRKKVLYGPHMSTASIRFK